MNTTGQQDRLALLERITRDAGARALAYFRQRAELVIEEKADPRDIVSRADREVETAIREAVAQVHPDDGFLGEEYGHQAGRSGVTWVIDPIDGTASFLAGQPSWCVSIALVDAEGTMAGAIHVPLAGEFYLAGRGAGAFLDGARLQLDPAPGIASGMTAIGASHRSDPAAIGRIVERLIRRGGMFYRNGSGALMLAYVAAGRLAGYFEDHMHPWDCLAGLLMIAEAGGRHAPYPGPAGLAEGGRVLAARPGAWDTLAEITADA